MALTSKPLTEAFAYNSRMFPSRIQAFPSFSRNKRFSAATIASADDIDKKEEPLSPVLPGHVKTWLDLQLPEGRCVGISMEDLPMSSEASHHPDSISMETIWQQQHWVHGCYHAEELKYGMQQMKETARKPFWMGRLALRLALKFPNYPILKDLYGRPLMKTDGNDCIKSSISHKGEKAVALISKENTSAVGVDLELTCRNGKRSIATRVLTASEQASLGRIPGVSAEEEVLLRFSLKEAIYKAVHPTLCHYVGFMEAEVTPFEDGTASCCWLLESASGRSKIDQLGELTVHWRKLEQHGLFLSSAAVLDG